MIGVKWKRASTGLLAFLMAAGFVSATALPASAATSSFPATADVHVSAGSPTTAWNQTTLRADDRPVISYMKFSVASIPSGSTINTVSLRLTGVGTQTTQTVNIHSVGCSWTEATTYNTRPALGTKLTSATIGAGVTRVFTLPKTSVPGNGVVCFALARSTVGGDSIVGSSEYATVANRPQLTVTHTPPPPVNNPPVVNAGPDQSITLPTNTVNLDGTVSDPDGDTLTTKWSQYSGSQGSIAAIADSNAVDTTVTFSNPGAYQFILQANDTAGHATIDKVQINVAEAPGVAPTANAGPDQMITLPNNVVQLDGTITNSTFAAWSKVSGPGTVTFDNSAMVDPRTTTFSAAGTYVLRLATSNNTGSASDTVTITVNP